jgi:CBS-domain-containing membrane protein
MTPFNFPLDHVPVTPEPPKRNPLLGAAIAFASVVVSGFAFYAAPVLTVTVIVLGLGWLFVTADDTTEEK